MRKFFAVAVLLVSSACHPKSEPTLGPPPISTQTIQSSGGSTAINLVNDSRVTKLTVLQPIDVAWSKLQSAYATLGLRASTLDNQSHILATQPTRLRRKLGDIQLVKAMNCGGNSSTPNAETYDLTLVFESRLSPAPGGVTLVTFISGVGKDPLTNSGNQVPCYSMGVIENRIAALMTAK